MATCTRFSELAFERVHPGLWRIIDVHAGRSHIGPHYRTRDELLADLERFASEYGCDNAVRSESVNVELLAALVDLLDGQLTDLGGLGGAYITASGDCIRRCRAAIARAQA